MSSIDSDIITALKTALVDAGFKVYDYISDHHTGHMTKSGTYVMIDRSMTTDWQPLTWDTVKTEMSLRMRYYQGVPKITNKSGEMVTATTACMDVERAIYNVKQGTMYSRIKMSADENVANNLRGFVRDWTLTCTLAACADKSEHLPVLWDVQGALDDYTPLFAVGNQRLMSTYSDFDNNIRVGATQTSIDFVDHKFDSGAWDIATANDANNAYNSTWYDQSGNGHNVIQDTASLQPVCNRDGNSSFDGVDDRVCTANITTTSDNLTFGFVFKTPNLSGVRRTLLASYDYSSSKKNWYLYILNGKIYGDFYEPNGVIQSISSDAIISSGDWHVVTGQYTDTFSKLFIDGVKVSVNSTGHSAFNNIPCPICVGANLNGGAIFNPFYGNISNAFIIVDANLTDAQHLDIYNKIQANE